VLPAGTRWEERTRRLYEASAGVRVMQITLRPEIGRSQASPIAKGSANPVAVEREPRSAAQPSK
jgi:hypothetical protein